jgi:hypothetical protein
LTGAVKIKAKINRKITEKLRRYFWINSITSLSVSSQVEILSVTTRAELNGKVSDENEAIPKNRTNEKAIVFDYSLQNRDFYRFRSNLQDRRRGSAMR